MARRHLIFIAVLMAISMVAAACSSADTAGTTPATDAPVAETTTVTDAPATTRAPTTTRATTTTEAPATTTTAVAFVSTCDWESPRLPVGVVEAPTTPGDGEPAEAILGSWQHLAIDSGSGFEPLGETKDIRYVLGDGTFLYCQTVVGATDQAENSAPLEVDGATIVLPSPAYGYEVVAWNDTTMVWRNLFDDSLYLLERR